MDEFENLPQVTTDPLAHLLKEAVELARQAGELTLGYFRSAGLSVEQKSDGSPVTQADRQAERLIREELELRHPGDGILGEEEDEVVDFRNEMRQGDRTRMPGAVRASAGINTTEADVSRLVSAVSRIAGGEEAPVTYIQDPRSGDFNPYRDSVPWFADVPAGSCAGRSEERRGGK